MCKNHFGIGRFLCKWSYVFEYHTYERSNGYEKRETHDFTPQKHIVSHSSLLQDSKNVFV